MDVDVRIRKTLALAWERCPALRRRMEEAGLDLEDIRGEEELARIPVLKKDQLGVLQTQAPPFGGLLAVDVKDLARIFVSPGPIFDPQGAVPDYWRRAQALEAAGFGPGDLVVNTFSYHLTPAGFMYDEGLRALGAVVVPTGVGNRELQVEIITKLGITGFVGTPSFLAALLEVAREKGWGPGSFPIRKALVSAEPLPSSLRDMFQDEWEIDTYQCYGTADVGTIGFECSQKEGLHLAQDMVVQICDPVTGEPLPPGQVGEVVVTLLSPVYPLIRFGTGDLSKFLEDSCPCGRWASPRLAGFMGRVGDAVKVRGLFIHGHQVKALAGEFPWVKALQVVVDRVGVRDTLTLLVEEEGASPEDLEALQKRASELFRLKVDYLETVASGGLEGAKPLEDLRKWD